jgi:ribosome-associated protein
MCPNSDSHGRLAREPPSRARHPIGGPLNNDAIATTTTQQTPLNLERAIECARIGEDNKAKDIVILDLRGITPIFDFFILMTGASRRQIHTLAEEVDDYMRTEGEKRLSIQGYQASRWVAQDYGDIVVHVFDKDSREYYALEDLWADAPRVEWKRG